MRAPIYIYRAIFLVTIVIFLHLAPANSQDNEFVDSNSEGFVTYLSRTLPENLLLGTKNTLSFWNIAALGGATVGSLILSQTDADRNIQDDLNDSLGNFGKIGDIGGNALTLAGINAAVFLIGRTANNEKLFETAKALLEANILTAFSTSVLKLSVGRERPDGSGTRFTSSFPSGHTSGSFALASTFDTMYGHKVGIPLYAAAGFVGLSRISDNKHFLSDVLFGAVLGTVIGRSAAKVHEGEEKGRFTILPHTDGYSTGIALTLTW